MNLINKMFGPSKIQEEFQKSIALKLHLNISEIDKAEFTIQGNQISKKNSNTSASFDFNSNMLIFSGDWFDEIFNDFIFDIVRIEKTNKFCEIYLSRGDSRDIVMKCLIYRSHILFQGILENWSFKISGNFKISH
jgi:hypothetical protein